MKAILPVLLIVSVVGNGALAIVAFRAQTTPGAISSASNSAVEVGSPQPSAPAVTATVPTAKTTASTLPPGGSWRTPRSDDELRAFIDNLRAAGYPPSVLRAVANQLIQEKFAATRPDANQPFWKRQQPTPEMLAAQQARSDEINAFRESILGADGTPSAMLDPVERQRRYGNLSNDKIDALIRLEREYNNVASMTHAARGQNRVASMDSVMQQQKLIEEEKLADLASVLSPDELAAYEMRSSNSANKLMSTLRNVEITEQEYAALYQVQKAHDAANTTSFTANNPAAAVQRMTAQNELNEQMRTVLGEERFYNYLEGADFQYATVTRFTNQYPAVKPATAYQLYQLQTDLQRELITRSSTGAVSAEAAQALRESYGARLDALLPPDVAEAYKKLPTGRFFTTGSGSTTTITAQPAVRLPGGGN